ncbi:MAG TPA: Gfo/Idh/MocA family oxidoreductase [Gemmatimonadaceae bacterium]|nr:Gfo/Idh/MocA family oxidoreductase [Gemmatimonadaceae bacterium]
MSDDPRVGVVGAGSLGFHHIRILRDLPGIRFAGFYESRPERREEVEKELGVLGQSDLAPLIEACDAVVIVVPTSKHFEVASAAIDRGRHVFIEKPITPTIEEADALLSKAKDRGVMVQIGHIERFNRAVRAALPYIGKPRFIDSERLAPFSPRGSDVAVVLDLMIHDIDLLLTLVGSEAQDISAVGVPVLTPMLDIANARVTFNSGAVANITSSRISRERKRKIRIFQQSGYVSLDLGAGTGEFFRLRSDIDPLALRAAPADITAYVDRIKLEAPEGEPLKLELESFVSALKGESAVVVTGEEGRLALGVALRIVKEIELTLPSLVGHTHHHA